MYSNVSPQMLSETNRFKFITSATRLCFHPRFCVRVCICLSVSTITLKISNVLIRKFVGLYCTLPKGKLIKFG